LFFGCSCFVASLAGLRCSPHQRVVGSRSSRASQRRTMRFMRTRSVCYARGYSSVQHYSALAPPFHAQATTVSAVCQAGFALFRRCGLTIRSSGLPMSVCAKIQRRRRQPLNSSVRHTIERPNCTLAFRFVYYLGAGPKYRRYAGAEPCQPAGRAAD